MKDSNGSVREVVSSPRAIRKFFGANHEAVQRVIKAPVPDEEAWETAAFLGALGAALSQFETEAEIADPELFVAPHSPIMSLIQSFCAERAADTRQLQPIVEGGHEIRMEEGAAGLDLGWLGTLPGYLRFRPKCAIKRPAGTIPEPLPNPARVVVLGDWGTGLYGAPECAVTIARDERPPNLLLHLGDIYYSGTKREVQDRFLSLWPQPAGAIQRALNGNHEMYSGGQAYYETVLPAFQQASSYFALQNQHWTLIGLDTGYLDGPIDQDQMKWLEDVLSNAEERRILLFSHHNAFSLFDGAEQAIAAQLRPVLQRKKVFAWYWGHEHRCALFDCHPDYGLLARCLGHGGIPRRRDKVQDAPVEASGQGWSWRRLGGHGGPGGLHLDGVNNYVKEHGERYAPNGYLTLELVDAHVCECVHLPNGDELWRRELT